MVTIASFSVGVDDFPAGQLIGAHAVSRVELETLIPTNDRVLPYFRVWGDSVDSFIDDLEAEPYIASATVIERSEDTSLVRVEWADKTVDLVGSLAMSPVDLLSAVGDEHAWRFTIRAKEREDIAEFQRISREHEPGITLDFEHIEDVDDTDDRQTYGLTDAQLEAVLAAYEHGYFDEPRTVTMEELAAELGIARSSLSSRLRRAHRKLIERTVAVG